MTRSYAALPEMNMAFAGAKLAILTEGAVISILRDDRPDIPYPNHWDLPGGGREGDESPVDCVLRETREELGIALLARDISWGKVFGIGASRTWFFASCLSADRISDIRLGEEGQTWDRMPLDTFLRHERAVPHFQDRLRLLLKEGF